MYQCALKTLESRLEILCADYQTFQSYNPFDHIESRIKSYESMAGKLLKKNLPLTAAAAEENLKDIAGIRIICSFAEDIQRIVSALRCQGDLRLIRETDYVQNPKESGYRSYHMLFTVPVYLSDRVEHVYVEIQIRTHAMNFWASLEHKARYKYEGNVPEHLADELRRCANKIDDLDQRMYLIHDIIQLING